MEVSLKNKVILSVVLLVVAFGFGRYSATPDIKITKTEDIKKVEDKNTHTKVTMTETKKPDGTDVKVTVSDEVANDVITINQDTKTQTMVSSKSKTNISVLVGTDMTRFIPVYGISVNKEIFGPVTVGAFGLMNGVVGASVGISF